MAENSEIVGKKVYQFRIKLRDVMPPIWRRIQVPSSFNFGQLHLAIQKSMGWGSHHLHQFKIKGDVITTNLDTVTPGLVNGDIDERKVYIEDYFKSLKQRALYEHDFGDAWEHDVVLEKIVPAQEGEKYPKCLEGKRACPPDDCGGDEGYEDLLQAINDPGHKEHEFISNWMKNIGRFPFDPEKFSPDHVFDGFEEWEPKFRPYS